ncbi:MAG TPA: S41 family peptidase [Anaerolineaceae bacterium]|nr:S41 family peptidase [Anaerolineaceae bacterium]
MTIKKITSYLWILLNVCLGFALGWLISFGFLNLDDQILIFIISGSSAIIHAFITYQIIKNGKHKKTLKKLFFSIQLLIVILIAGIYLSQSFIFQNKPLLSSDYEKSFTKLWKAMDRAYPYFELKNVDWDEMYDIYYPKVQMISDQQEYFEMIAQMLAELEDGHTNVVSPPLEKRIFASVRMSGDLAMIDQIGYSAEMAGLRPGDLLLGLNGKSIEDIIPTIDITYKSASTPWARKLRAINQLLTVPDDENEVLIVTVLDHTSQEKEIQLRRLEVPSPWSSTFNEESKQAVTWDELTADIGYIRIDRLWNNQDDIVKEFDDALNSFFQKEGIILDLRQNGGGDSRMAEKIAGRFLDKSFVYGRDEFKQRLFKFAWRESVNYSVKPRETVYPGKLVVLIDYPVMSSAEWLVGSLVDSSRAITVGRTTGGATGNPIQFSFPGGSVRYSTASFYRPDGQLVEGQGYTPDVVIEWTIEDYLKGIDPDIQAAIEWIEQQE